MKLSKVVEDYIARHRTRAQRELRYYAIQRSLSDTIHEAALSRLPSGKRHPHQRRIPRRVLIEAERALQQEADRLSYASSFSELYGYVEATIGNIRGIGALAAYDIAHRIGSYLKLEPELIYLHAGTRDGARVLGVHGKTVHRSKLPRELRRLDPAEIEDCLCIYKDELRTNQRLRPKATPCA